MNKEPRKGHPDDLSSLSAWLKEVATDKQSTAEIRNVAGLVLSSVSHLGQNDGSDQECMKLWNDLVPQLHNNKERYRAGRILVQTATATVYFKIATTERGNKYRNLFLLLIQEAIEGLHDWYRESKGNDCGDNSCPFQTSEQLFSELYLSQKRKWKEDGIWKMAGRQYVLLEKAKALSEDCPLRNILFEKRNHVINLCPWLRPIAAFVVICLIYCSSITVFPATLAGISQLVRYQADNLLSPAAMMAEIDNSVLAYVDFLHPSIALVMVEVSFVLCCILIALTSSRRINAWLIHRIGD